MTREGCRFGFTVVIQKLLYADRHSGLDPESSLFNWIPAFVGMTNLVIISKEVLDSLHYDFPL